MVDLFGLTTLGSGIGVHGVRVVDFFFCRGAHEMRARSSCSGAADAGRRVMSTVETWPQLRHAEWADTQMTLHMWMQVVGKICLAQTPLLNHWWNVPLRLTARGLVTPPIPHGSRHFDIAFDFVSHELVLRASDGEVRVLPLAPMSVADFYGEVMAILHSLGLPVQIWTTPVEVADPIPFEKDTVHRSYDAEHVHAFWSVVGQVHRVLGRFASRFVGKASPIHFFWGSFDLAYSRFSGRRAPVHGPVPNTGRSIVREAYSHEVMSCGFWPGAGDFDAAIYAYAYPEPEGFESAPIGPRDAFYSPDLHEWVLPYESVRTAVSPDNAILQMVEDAYEATAELAGWDRELLERDVVGAPGRFVGMGTRTGRRPTQGL
jgi:hypothetical protein